MSNPVAVAAVTSTICYVLEQSLAGQPGALDQAQVTRVSPGELAASIVGNPGLRGLNVYLYEVVPDLELKATRLPRRLPGGRPSAPTFASVDLRFLITAYGQDLYLEPHRLIARAVLALSATPTLTDDLITTAITLFAERTGLEFLADADLADQMELVTLAPQLLTLDEVAQLWGRFRAPYLLSLAYTANAVVLETA